MAPNNPNMPSCSQGVKRKSVVLTLLKLDIARRLKQSVNQNVLKKEYSIGSSANADDPTSAEDPDEQ